MGAPVKYKGEFIEGSFHAHQVPIPDAKTDKEGLKILQEWLSSYNAAELFTERGRPIDEVLSVVPQDKDKRLGQVKETYAGRETIIVPDWKELGVTKGSEESCMRLVGKYMDKVFLENPTSTRIFSPDELESNKLAAVFEHTGRNFQWDEYSSGQGGRVIEILSEHTCQGRLESTSECFRLLTLPGLRNATGIHNDWTYCPFPILRGLHWNCTDDDGPIRQVRQDGQGDQLPFSERLSQLPRDLHVDSPGTQRFLSPEPVVHWCGPQPQS
jgi:xylulose-5-phosphate/fructose-6-phosphate phosphoketolase